jgi:hypothetical protein
MSNDDDEAERQNNLMATGAVVGALQFAGTIKFDPPEQKIDNRFTVRFPFLKSRYVITVERVPDTEEQNHEQHVMDRAAQS